MNGRRYGPFTLFLCFCLLIFLLFSPYYLKKPPINELYDKIFKREIGWRGIITVWDFPRLDITSGQYYSWLRDKIREFEKKYPGVIIEFERLDPVYWHIQIDTAAKAKALPDIAPVGANFEIISKGLLEPLEEYIAPEDLDDFKVQAITAVKYKDQIFGLPYKIEPYVLLLNKEIFMEREVPLPEKGNWTYEEFQEALKKLTFTKDRIKYYGFNSYIQNNCYNTWGIILGDGGEVIDHEYNFSFYGDKVLSGLKKLYDLKHALGVTPEDFGVNTMEEGWRSFAIEKRVAVYPEKASKINELRLLASQGKGFEFDFSNYPIGDSKIPISFGYNVEAFGIFKQDDEDKLKMCVEFIKFLTDKESQLELYKQGVFPTRKSVGNIYNNDDIMNRIQENLAYAKDAGYHGNWSQIDDILQNQIRLMLMGEKTPEETMEEIKKKLENISLP